MRRGVEQGGVVLEHRLRAVAVMDVEIDDRDALQPVHLAGALRRDRDVVEEAEKKISDIEGRLGFADLAQFTPGKPPNP